MTAKRNDLMTLGALRLAITERALSQFLLVARRVGYVKEFSEMMDQRMEWNCLSRVGGNLNRDHWIPALLRGYFEPQNIEHQTRNNENASALAILAGSREDSERTTME